MKIGVIVVGYERPAMLVRTLAALGRQAHAPVGHVVVVDNSPQRQSLPSFDGTPCDITYRWRPENVGLPCAIAEGLSELLDRNCDAILILDDDTVLSSHSLACLLQHLPESGGVATVPTPFTRTFGCDRAGDPAAFPWSPALFTKNVIVQCGRPSCELFWGWDDWEYASRVRAKGFEIVWADCPLAQQKAPPGDGFHVHPVWEAYISARNLAYLATRKKHRLGLPLARRLKATTVFALKSMLKGGEAHTPIFLGFVHGALGRMGPPPQHLSSLHDPRPT